MTKVHLLHGFVGAGKTTFARKLEQETGAIRFTFDEWMVRLYGNNPPASEYCHYYQRIEGLIWDMAIKLMDKKVDVIIDSGFWSRASRDNARRLVLDKGAKPILYHITCPENLMRQRVATRTADLPSDSLWINQAAFDEFKNRFEPLTEDEDCITVNTTIEQGGSSEPLTRPAGL